MIVTNIIALYLFNSHRTIAYLTGLFSFLFSLIFQIIATGKILMWSDKFAIMLIVCIVYFYMMNSKTIPNHRRTNFIVSLMIPLIQSPH